MAATNAAPLTTHHPAGQTASDRDTTTAAATTMPPLRATVLTWVHTHRAAPTLDSAYRRSRTKPWKKRSGSNKPSSSAHTQAVWAAATLA